MIGDIKWYNMRVSWCVWKWWILPTEMVAYPYKKRCFNWDIVWKLSMNGGCFLGDVDLHCQQVSRCIFRIWTWTYQTNDVVLMGNVMIFQQIWGYFQGYPGSGIWPSWSALGLSINLCTPKSSGSTGGGSTGDVLGVAPVDMSTFGKMVASWTCLNLLGVVHQHRSDTLW